MSQDISKIPTVSSTAFACPHCGAYTTQGWQRLFCLRFDDENRTPRLYTQADRDEMASNDDLGEVKDVLVAWVDELLTGEPFLESRQQGVHLSNEVHNLYLTACFNCRKLAVWVHDRIVYPRSQIEIQPSQDLPDHIAVLFREASGIVDESPRGAAALLRLSIQHLCKSLGESGKHLDSDIANLVAKGLNPTVQMSLDVVRVVGNESVHPGEIDLNDDREAALKLFELVNIISDQMITHPKMAEELYAKLPKAKREAIENRDRKKKK